MQSCPKQVTFSHLSLGFDTKQMMQRIHTSKFVHHLYLSAYKQFINLNKLKAKRIHFQYPYCNFTPYKNRRTNFPKI